MKRITWVLLACALLVVAAGSYWMLAKPGTPQTPQAKIETAKPRVAAVPQAPPAVPEPAPIKETVSPSSTPEPPTAEIVPAATLTAETLKGTKWADGHIDMVFLADGQWQMNGRTCAKWKVEGDRVKIYDDKGEVHYVDIVGNSLEFNGQKIGRVSG